MCYFIRESDFIDILMSEIKDSIESLPDELDPVDVNGNFNIIDQIQEKSPFLIDK